MEIIGQYITQLDAAYELAIPNLREETVRDLEQKLSEIISDLQSNSFIKVPIVGDFNAGKSSMLNVLLGRDLLPTDIKPETAYCYEIYYSQDEHLEVENGDKTVCHNLNDIKNVGLCAGEVVKLFVNCDAIKELQNKGIVLVDMPGIGSGIEAHNKAVFNYLEKGTSFVLVTDVREGAFTSSSLDFIREIKKYALSCSVIITKIETKNETELAAIRAQITESVHRNCGSDAFVGCISAHKGNIKDFETLLNSLDGETFVAEKFSTVVSAFVKSLVVQLGILRNSLLTSDSTLERRIAELKEKKEEFLEEMKAASGKSQPVGDSVSDVLNDVRNELFKERRALANLLYSHADSKDVSTLFGNQMLSIIRPVLYQSIMREGQEYQDVIAGSLDAFVEQIKAIVDDKNNPILNNAEALLSNSVIKETLEELLEAGIIKLLAKLGITKTLGPVLGTIVGVILSLLPDLLRVVFGVGKEKKIASIIELLENSVFEQVVANLRQPVTEIIVEQRRVADESIKATIQERIEAINASIEQALQQKTADESSKRDKVESLAIAIEKISAMV